MSHELPGAGPGPAGDFSFALDGYNPASQITGRTVTSGYYWSETSLGTDNYSPNGLNQ